MAGITPNAQRRNGRAFRRRSAGAGGASPARGHGSSVVARPHAARAIHRRLPVARCGAPSRLPAVVGFVGPRAGETSAGVIAADRRRFEQYVAIHAHALRSVADPSQHAGALSSCRCRRSRARGGQRGTGKGRDSRGALTLPGRGCIDGGCRYRTPDSIRDGHAARDGRVAARCHHDPTAWRCTGAIYICASRRTHARRF